MIEFVPENVKGGRLAPATRALIRRLAASYWNVIRSERVSVTAFGFKGSFTRFALPEFKTL